MTENQVALFVITAVIMMIGFSPFWLSWIDRRKRRRQHNERN